MLPPLGGLRATALGLLLLALSSSPATAGVLPDIPDVVPVVTETPSGDAPLPGVPELPAGPSGSGAPLPALPLPPGAPSGSGGGGVVAVPPIAFSGSVADAAADRATVTGVVIPGSAPATVAIEYGRTPAYTQRSTPVTLAAGAAPVPVSGRLSGLPPGTAIHYRVVAASAAGTSAGEDRTLTTAAGAAVLAALARGVRGSRPGVAVTAPSQAALGRPTELTVQTRSGSVGVTGLIADFDEAGGRTALLACDQDERGRRPISGPLAPGGAGSFALINRFRRAGRHRVTFTLLGGTCASAVRRLRTLRSTVTVLPRAAVAARRARASAAASACRDAGLRPTRANRKRIEIAVRCLLGAERAAHGLPTLRPSARLSRTARGHASDMLRRRYLAHAHPQGPRLSHRLRRVGYRARAGEAIGLGAGSLATPAGIVRLWMGSTVHRDVILRARYRAVGVGVRPGAPVRLSGAGTYVANLGTRP